MIRLIARGFGLALTLAFFASPAFAGLRVERDAYCYRESDGAAVGVVLAGTQVEPLEQADGKTLIYSERHNAECWLSDKAFEARGYIHPDDLEQTLKWRTLVQRWMPDFPNLTEELVLSVIYKETKGDPHAVDATGNDVRMVGAASVGLMGAIPRPHLPCYAALTGANGKDEYACQILLGMHILNSAIERANELNTGNRLAEASRLGLVMYEVQCNKSLETDAVGWLRYGEEVDVFRSVRDADLNYYYEVYSPRHGRNCWVPQTALVVNQDVQPAVEAEITDEDIALGIELYGCTEHNVLADNCLPWGGETYASLVLDVILPEITQALEKGD